MKESINLLVGLFIIAFIIVTCAFCVSPWSFMSDELKGKYGDEIMRVLVSSKVETWKTAQVKYVRSFNDSYTHVRYIDFSLDGPGDQFISIYQKPTEENSKIQEGDVVDIKIDRKKFCEKEIVRQIAIGCGTTLTVRKQ